MKASCFSGLQAVSISFANKSTASRFFSLAWPAPQSSRRSFCFRFCSGATTRPGRFWRSCPSVFTDCTWRPACRFFRYRCTLPRTFILTGLARRFCRGFCLFHGFPRFVWRCLSPLCCTCSSSPRIVYGRHFSRQAPFFCFHQPRIPGICCSLRFFCRSTGRGPGFCCT